MADATVPGLGDLLSLLGGGANLFSGVGKQIDQFKRLSTELVVAVENINRTMESLNGTVQRVNGLIDEVEAPIRALMPQVTRSIKAMDSVTGPLTNLPKELAGVVDILGDVAKRLQPLTQMAESAGSLFGLRPLANLRAGSGRLQSSDVKPPPAPIIKPKTVAPKTAGPKKAAPKTAAPKKAAPKKASRAKA